MKKVGLLTTLLFGSLLLVGCNNKTEEPTVINEPEINIEANESEIENTEITTPEINETDENKALIVYFSPTGNTKRIATFISEINGAEITEIIPAQEYTDEDRNWRNNESRSFKEHEDPSIRPEIQNELNFDEYDTIYLGYPIWFGVTPNIILTLLEKYDLTGKTIVLFCTSEHVGIENSVEYLKPYNLNVIGSKRFAADSTKEEVQEWLKSL